MKYIRAKTDTTVVSPQSVTEGTFSQSCAFLSHKKTTWIHPVAR